MNTETWFTRNFELNRNTPFNMKKVNDSQRCCYEWVFSLQSLTYDLLAIAEPQLTGFRRPLASYHAKPRG